MSYSYVCLVEPHHDRLVLDNQYWFLETVRAALKAYGRTAAVSGVDAQPTVPTSKNDLNETCAHCGKPRGGCAYWLRNEVVRLNELVADHEEVHRDHQRLVRDLDVLLNGEAGAAKQASLCDIVSQMARAKHPETPAPRSFQDRVFDWARDCFGEHDTTSREMRTYRFLEEALELAQACGCSQDAATRVLEYVYGRPAGEVAQETGGTMVSLAVLCQAFGIGMNRCAEAELTRVLGKIEHIRARHAAKPDFSSAVKTPVVNPTHQHADDCPKLYGGDCACNPVPL